MSYTSSHIDYSVIKELVELCSEEEPDFLIELISRYLESAPRYYENILKGKETQKWEIVRISAHSLKSSSANLGAFGLSELCQKIELHSKLYQDTYILEELLVELDEVFEKSKAELVQIMQLREIRISAA